MLSKPRERRMLIEEAAGLGKHRKRRRRAQLKLERTRSNLDRALDVEREARSRLRPLRQQANAAETHARLERQSLELQLRLLGDRLAAGGGDLATAEAAARTAREARDGIEAKLAEANERRSKVEQRLAERDRERTAVWGELTALRAAHERLGARTESIAGARGGAAGRGRAPPRRPGNAGGRAARDRARCRGGAGERARIRPRRPRRGEHRDRRRARGRRRRVEAQRPRPGPQRVRARHPIGPPGRGHARPPAPGLARAAGRVRGRAGRDARRALRGAGRRP